MRVYDLKDGQGRVFAFEIENLLISRHGVCSVVETIPSAVVIERPRRFLLVSPVTPEEFCEFELEGQRFRAWEPFGDNSRYWIGPEPPKWCPQLDGVRKAFVAHVPVLGHLRRLFKRATTQPE